eukprot:2168447-Amphidinium_carterae.1
MGLLLASFILRAESRDFLIVLLFDFYEQPMKGFTSLGSKQTTKTASPFGCATAKAPKPHKQK